MKTILLVDDDPLIVKVYRAPLANGGFNVEVAEDGLMAMKMLAQLRPDLVILDVMMPKMDGAYVLKYIHSRPELKATKVVILSDASIADAAKDALAEKPDRVFLKSRATPRELLQTVNELLGAAPLGPQ